MLPSGDADPPAEGQRSRRYTPKVSEISEQLTFPWASVDRWPRLDVKHPHRPNMLFALLQAPVWWASAITISTRPGRKFRWVTAAGISGARRGACRGRQSVALREDDNAGSPGGRGSPPPWPRRPRRLTRDRRSRGSGNSTQPCVTRLPTGPKRPAADADGGTQSAHRAERCGLYGVTIRHSNWSLTSF